KDEYPAAWRKRFVKRLDQRLYRSGVVGAVQNDPRRGLKHFQSGRPDYRGKSISGSGIGDVEAMTAQFFDAGDDHGCVSRLMGAEQTEIHTGPFSSGRGDRDGGRLMVRHIGRLIAKGKIAIELHEAGAALGRDAFDDLSGFRRDRSADYRPPGLHD